MTYGMPCRCSRPLVTAEGEPCTICGRYSVADLIIVALRDQYTPWELVAKPMWA